jgi:caffeoyl-CoA O-methyltransferase
LAYFDTLISCKDIVELENERPIVANILGVRCIIGCHQRAIPQRVIITDHTPDFHELDQPLVVLGVVVLVGIDEYEVEEAVVLLLPIP